MADDESGTVDETPRPTTALDRTEAVAVPAAPVSPSLLANPRKLGAPPSVKKDPPLKRDRGSTKEPLKQRPKSSEVLPESGVVCLAPSHSEGFGLPDRIEKLSNRVFGVESWLEILVAQNQRMNDTVMHLSLELAAVHARPSFASVPESPAFDALAHAPPPIPGPRDENPRYMQMREREQLQRAIECIGLDSKVKGVIRIAEPDAKPNTHVEIRISEYTPATLWKLWHYVMLSKTLQTVLTVKELKASAPPPVPAEAQ